MDNAKVYSSMVTIGEDLLPLDFIEGNEVMRLLTVIMTLVTTSGSI